MGRPTPIPPIKAGDIEQGIERRPRRRRPTGGLSQSLALASIKKLEHDGGSRRPGHLAWRRRPEPDQFAAQSMVLEVVVNLAEEDNGGPPQGGQPFPDRQFRPGSPGKHDQTGWQGRDGRLAGCSSP